MTISIYIPTVLLYILGISVAWFALGLVTRTPDRIRRVIRRNLNKRRGHINVPVRDHYLVDFPPAVIGAGPIGGTIVLASHLRGDVSWGIRQWRKRRTAASAS